MRGFDKQIDIPIPEHTYPPKGQTSLLVCFNELRKLRLNEYVRVIMNYEFHRLESLKD
jgi:hypothetical protein